MKKSKFSEAQIAFALKQTEGGTPVEEVCRKMDVSEATFYNWKNKVWWIRHEFVKKDPSRHKLCRTKRFNNSKYIRTLVSLLFT